MWIATAEQSRRIDHRASVEFGLPPRVLMERAGLAVFEAVRELLPESGRIMVFCGKGHNGGDGFVVARLARDHGFLVECLVAAEENELRESACEQMMIARAQGIMPIFYSDARWQRRLENLGSYDLTVDALLGTGAHNNVCGPVREAIQAINRSGVPVVSVDVPSGIHCDTGEELGESVWALRTVTFGLPKPFLFEGIGLEHSGYWTVAEIGYPTILLNEPTHARLVDNDWVSNLLPERLRASHKGDNGNVLIVAGSRNMRGAAVLSARAAMRAGAGLVTVASVPEVCDAIAAQLPEAILLPLPTTDGVLGVDAAHELMLRRPKAHSAVFGPGLSHTESTRAFLSTLWKEWNLPCVVDADALNAVSEGLELPQADCVLTPHPGEMSRMMHSSIAEVQCDRFHTMEAAVARYRQAVLLKGPYSIVGEPDQPMLVNHSGNPGLASAGMGDVLSGILGTLLAQDLPGYYAAACAMYWHGVAADLCAQRIGPIGYTATEVCDMVPAARAKIVGTCEPK